MLSLFELARSAAVLDAVEGVLGPDILCWGASLFVKEGGEPSRGPWGHSDAAWCISK